MKPVKNYILLVDAHRRPSRQRNTAGRYRVAAKTPDEAVSLLREKIGFGSIQVYYECKSDEKLNVPYKSVVKEVSREIEKEDGSICIGMAHIEPHHANAPQSGNLEIQIHSAERRHDNQKNDISKKLVNEINR